VVPDAGFKKCCMPSGRYDGVERDYFFPRMTLKPPTILGGFFSFGYAVRAAS